MHGLINRAIECFTRDSYGPETWDTIVQQLDLGFSEFEPMLGYDDSVTVHLISSLSAVLNKQNEEVLEDIGTYLVSHPNAEALRRLLRFGGETFCEFLHSLDDLPARAQLAVSDLVLPRLELRDHGGQGYHLVIQANPGDELLLGYVFAGLLRALADDYGALAFIDHKGGNSGEELLEIKVVEAKFAVGRRFSLGVPAQ